MTDPNREGGTSTISPSIGPFPQDDDDNEQEDVRRMFQELLEGQQDAKKEREEIRDDIPDETLIEDIHDSDGWGFEETLESVVLAGLMLGFVGLLASIVSGGYIFSPIFLISLLFLLYIKISNIPESI